MLILNMQVVERMLFRGYVLEGNKVIGWYFVLNAGLRIKQGMFFA